jgi:hypothetical protein
MTLSAVFQNRNPYRYVLCLLGIIYLLYGIRPAIGQAQYRTPLEQLQRAYSGKTKIPMTKQGILLQQLKPVESQLNALYNRFLGYEDLSVPQDGKVVLIRDLRSSDGILILFHTNGKVVRLHNSKSLHKRIADLMVDELEKHVPAQDTSWAFFTAGVDTTYNPQQPTTYESRNWQRTLAVRLTMFRPDLVIGETYPEDTGTGAEKITKTAQELALERFQPAEGAFHEVYQPFLDLNGLRWELDARLYMQLHEYLEDALLITFELSPRALKADPDLTYHKKLAEKLGYHFQQKVRDQEIDWLQFKVAADTSNGEKPPVFLF